MSNAVRAESVRFSIRLNDANAMTFERVLQAHWSAFAAIWWDIGLVATPARQILDAASVAHDAVDEWRDEFPFLLHDVPCCFRITRHTWSRCIDAHEGQRARLPNNERHDIRMWMRRIERGEWPPLPGRNDYRGNVRDTAWVDDLGFDANGDVAPSWNLASIGQSNAIGTLTSWSTAPQAPIETLLAMRDAMLAQPAPQAMFVPPGLYERLQVHYAVSPEPTHHDSAEHVSFGAALARAATKLTPSPTERRAARRKRKRGRR